ncbi:ATP synthase subunit I [Francisella frigiditurris]|uniref:ATP synthase I chain family protein n=1 Tax=Francisella frigiditurris TaxID=1542390 RepID=A0A1J0KSY6_9GAMM|nr:ATP synthase subunit I [Francisella frigiditurris]APC96810.1 ATP synthase I chain family protein [Francisella frigiditurris]
MLANVGLDIRKFVFSQVFVLILGSCITYFLYSSEYLFSFLLGGGVIFLANFIFFSRFLMRKQFNPGIELLIFYLSEAIKLTLVALITILLAIYIKPKLFPYIFGLISLQLVMCFVPMFLVKVK